VSTVKGGFVALDDGRAYDVVVGRVRKAEPNRDARRPAYLLEIDLGQPRGRHTTVAPLTRGYAPEELIGRQLLCAVEVPPRRREPLRVTVLAALGPDSSLLVLGPSEERDDGAALV